MRLKERLVDINISEDKCINCGKCVSVCPKGVYEIVNGLIKIGDTDNCIGCMACVSKCPQNAISLDNRKFKKLFVAKRCNNNCIMCFEHDVNIHKEYSTDKILEEVNNNIHGEEEMVILSGAEITLRKDLFKILRAIRNKNKGGTIFLPTNGRVFSVADYVKEFNDLNLGNIKITVSILGSRKATHEKITRTNNSFNQSVKGIKNLLSLGHNVHLNVTILKQNYTEILEICKRFLPMGVRTIQLAIVEPNGKAAKNFQEMIPTISELRPYLKKALRYGGGKVKSKNIPNCVLGKYKDFKFFETQGHLKEKPEKCNFCKYGCECEGFWKEYFRIYGDNEIIPIK